MNQYNPNVAARPNMDAGLRDYMLGTYRWMAAAMAVTGTVAYFTSQFIATNPSAQAFLIGNAVVSLVFIGVVMFGFAAIGKRLPTMSLGSMVTALFGFAALLGVIASPIALFYDPVSIAKVFFMAVAMFGGLSLFGYSTNSNLGTGGRYAAMGFLAFVGIQLLGLVFPALRPTGAGETIFLVVGLGLVAVITAWETQQLKQNYYAVAGMPGMAQKLSVFGAASLLLAFYNIFILLLQLFGNRE